MIPCLNMLYSQMTCKSPLQTDCSTLKIPIVIGPDLGISAESQASLGMTPPPSYEECMRASADHELPTYGEVLAQNESASSTT